MTRRASAVVACLLCIALVGCKPTAQPNGEAPPADAREALRRKIDAMYEGYRKSFPDVQEITVPELLTRRAKGDVIVVDGREDRERAVSVIPGAISLKAFTAAAAHKGKAVVFYCTIGARSGEQAKEFAAKGFDTYNLKGSILSWVLEGQGVVDPEGKPTKRVHVYGARWNLLPEDHEAVW